MAGAPSRSFRTLLEQARARRAGLPIEPEYTDTPQDMAPKPGDEHTYRALLDQMREGESITPDFADPVTEIQDKPDPTDDYLAKLISEYRASGRDFGDLQGEADQMAREQGYSDNIPNATGFKGVLSKISRAAGGFLRGMAGEKNKDGSPVSLVSELSRYKHGIDDKEGFEAKRDDLLKREVLPRYASKRELDKERIGTLEGEVTLRDKQLKTKADIEYKQRREARLAEAGVARNSLLKYRIDSDNENKAATRELRELEIQMRAETDANKRADTEAYARALAEWQNEGTGLIAAAKEADALYAEAKSPNSSASDEQIAELRRRMAATEEALGKHKEKKPVKGAVVADRPKTSSAGLRTPNPAVKAKVFTDLGAKYSGKPADVRERAAKEFYSQMQAVRLSITLEEIRKALGL